MIIMTPEFLVALGWNALSVGIVLLLLFIFCYLVISHPPKFRLEGAHVLVTGGSRGIGKALATELVYEGANVTIVARNRDMLTKVTKELRSLLAPSSTLQVHWVSMDLANAEQSDMDHLVYEAESLVGRPVDVLVNNCGGSVTANFDDITLAQFHEQIKFNYLSAVGMTKAVLPGMKTRRQGRIVYVSSMAGQMGIFGYTAYSGAKFALRGLTESLQMELRPHNIWLTLAYPPDTDTEGHMAEMDTMPPETALIGATAGLWPAKKIARQMIKGIRTGSATVSYGMDGWMLEHLSAGAANTTSTIAAMEQILLSGLLRMVALGYLKYFAVMIRKYRDNKVKRQ